MFNNGFNFAVNELRNHQDGLENFSEKELHRLAILLVGVLRIDGKDADQVAGFKCGLHDSKNPFAFGFDGLPPDGSC